MLNISKPVEYNIRSEGDINLSSERLKWNAQLSEQTRQIVEEDAAVFIHQSLSTPCLDVIENCEGPYLITKEGRKILDFHGNNLHQVGYKNKFVTEAIINQLNNLPFVPRRYTNQPTIDLAKKLIEKAPGDLNRVLFTTGGASANSVALKLARLKTGKHKVISMWGAFHGATLDTISIGGEPGFRMGIGPLMSGTEHVPPPDSYRSFWNNDPDQQKYVDYIEYVFQHEGDVGAFIAETMRNTDVQVPSKLFWKKIRELCDYYNVTLILDEITVSLGRTGRFFAFEHYDIVPDIVTIGKGLGGAIIPIGAVITKEKYNLAPEHSVGHFTHEKSPIGSAAALAVIEYIENENLIEKVVNLGNYAKARCEKLFNDFRMVGDIRGIGLLWGIELVLDRNTKERATVQAEKVLYHCLANGLSFKVAGGNVIVFAPPLIITEEQFGQAFDILTGAFAKYLK
jgi:4-aminobutyrate aminotransferase